MDGTTSPVGSPNGPQAMDSVAKASALDLGPPAAEAEEMRRAASSSEGLTIKQRNPTRQAQGVNGSP